RAIVSSIRTEPRSRSTSEYEYRRMMPAQRGSLLHDSIGRSILPFPFIPLPLLLAPLALFADILFSFLFASELLFPLLLPTGPRCSRPCVPEDPFSWGLALKRQTRTTNPNRKSQTKVLRHTGLNSSRRIISSL